MRASIGSIEPVFEHVPLMWGVVLLTASTRWAGASAPVSRFSFLRPPIFHKRFV